MLAMVGSEFTHSSIWLLCAFSPQVSAHTGHSVTLVDLNNDLLTRAEQRIKGSLQRVAKKQFPDDQKVCAISARKRAKTMRNVCKKKLWVAFARFLTPDFCQYF